MLKAVKKILFLSSFVYISVFSMRQIPKTTLKSFLRDKQFSQIFSKRYEQKALLYNSSILKCPSLDTLVGYMMNIEVGDHGTKNELNSNSDEVKLNIQQGNDFNSIHNDINNVTFVKRSENDESSKTTIIREFGKDGILSSTYKVTIDFNKTNSPEEATINAQIDDKKKLADQKELFDIAGGLKSGSTTFKPQSSLDTAQGRSNSIFAQADQQFLAMQKRDYLENQQAIDLAKIKSQLSAYLENFYQIVSKRQEDIWASIPVGVSRCKIMEIKCEFENKISKLKSELQSLDGKGSLAIPVNIADLDVNTFFEQILYKDRSKWTDQDYFNAFYAVELIIEIERLNFGIRISHSILDGFKKEINKFENDLQNLSIDEIEQEIIDLAKQKEEIDRDVLANKDARDVKYREASAAKKELGRCKQKIFYRKSTIRDLEKKLKFSEVEYAQAKEDFQLVLEEQQKYQKKIELAQNVCSKKQIAVQELRYQALQKEHDECNFDLANCSGHEVENQWLQRQEALTKTIEQNYVQYYQEYQLTPQAEAFLAIHGVDSKNLKTFFGTALQQQLHGEMCDIFSKAATMQAQFPYQNDLLTSVVNFADAAYDANKNNQLLLASQLLDVDCYLLKLNHQIIDAVTPYAQAAMYNLKHSVTDLAYMAAHPLETCKGLGKALYYVLETASLNDPELGSYEQLRDQRSEEIIAGLNLLGEKIANSTGPERFGALVGLAADIVIPEKILVAVGEVCGFVKTQAKVMRTLEGVAAMAEEQGLTQELIQVTEKLKVATQENIAKSFATELKEVKKIITIYNPDGSVLKKFKLLPEEKFISTVRTKGGKISAAETNKVLCDNAEYWVEQMNLAIEKVNDDLIKQYKKMNPIVGHPEKSVCIDLEHTISGKYELVMNKTNEYYQIQFKGGHKAGTIAQLEQKGYVKIHDIKEFGGGCKEYLVEDLFSGQMFPHTEFPPHWNAEKIAQETTRLTENAIANGSLNKNKHVIKITTEDGFDLKIVTNPQPEVHACESIENTVNRHIITARPDKG